MKNDFQVSTALRLGALAPPCAPHPALHPRLHDLQCSWLDDRLCAVRSSLPATLVQVSSWLFSVWCIATCFPSVCAPILKNATMLTDTDAHLPRTKVQRSLFYMSMILSWALTEVVYYVFHTTMLVGDGHTLASLTWAHYLTFFMLYPTGVGSEVLVNFATLPVLLTCGSAWFDTRL